MEDYKKKYEDAVKELKKFFINNDDRILYKHDIERVFPELKESEDERIRKAVIEFVKQNKSFTYCKGVSKDDCLAWLEKQGEKIDIANKEYWQGYREGKQEIIDKYSELEKQGEQKPTDKVEPKFKIGDWVIDKQDIVHQIANVIENVTYHTYGYDIVGGGYFNDNTEGVRLWTVQDAKDGDVLAVTLHPEGTWIGMFKEHDGCAFNSHCFVNTEGAFKLGESDHGSKKAMRPATKEQRDLLFQKMHEAGYEWDAEKKELRKIEQKPAWSEEDEGELINIIDFLNNPSTAELCPTLRSNAIDWLNSLKERMKGE